MKYKLEPYKETGTSNIKFPSTDLSVLSIPVSSTATSYFASVRHVPFESHVYFRKLRFGGSGYVTRITYITQRLWKLTERPTTSYTRHVGRKQRAQFVGLFFSYRSGDNEIITAYVALTQEREERRERSLSRKWRHKTSKLQ